jgi:uncharacterized protein YyaL (SSP411 family)
LLRKDKYLNIKRILGTLFIMALASANLNADPPGVVYTPELRQQLNTGLQLLGAVYQPRTEHLYEDGRPKFTNRLILEDSPYLRQHAHNPVDWHPWGPEAFEIARREGKPVFLSIGYSTCHWCHVMERESFESIEVAEYLNTHFISIKVDRERRPDIDEIYMTGVQVISGRGGWPMSSFLTADGKTFFGGTYYPQAQFLDLLKRAIKAWNENRAGLIEQAEDITTRVRRYLDQAQAAGTLGKNAPAMAAQQLLRRHDELQGGFSPAPKFPNEANYLFLTDYALRNYDQALIELIRFDLQTMARGGIYDQVGGGFHRYSTDNEWLVPHFEKMLYNQAQLARVFMDAAVLTGEAEFTRVARQILDYVLRDMTSPDGGFYSATDADSEGGEGLFFLWTPAQVRAVLSEADAELAISLFNISASGNFEGSNIPHLSNAADAMAAERGLSSDEFLQKVDQIRLQLYTARKKREHPGRDEKIITAWNGMMIMALSQAGHLPAGEAYAKAALKAGEFLWQNHRDRTSDSPGDRPAESEGKLYRTSLDGRSSIPGVQEDYAWLADAFISLYDLNQDSRWLNRARRLVETMQREFWDETNGGFFMNASSTTDANAAPVMGRPKDVNDGAVPSGNAVALNALARLARRPGSKDDFFTTDARAGALLSAFAQAINQSPSAFTYLLRAAQVKTNGEFGALQYAAHGGVKINARTASGKLIVEIKIRSGWHINAHEPLSKNLIPTSLTEDTEPSIWSLTDISYPQPITKKLGFQSEKLALYEGGVRLTARLQQNESVPVLPPLRIKLQLQACDEKVCLPPESLVLQVPVR